MTMAEGVIRQNHDFLNPSRTVSGIRAGVVSPQVSDIDAGALARLNTQLTMALRNAEERREAVRAASSDIAGFAQELHVLDRGQLLLSSSLRDIALPVQVPNYDDIRGTYGI